MSGRGRGRKRKPADSAGAPGKAPHIDAGVVGSDKQDLSAGPATDVSADVDIDTDRDLRAALALEKLDLSTIDADTASTVKLLWTDRACRVKLRGELASFTSAKIDWGTLLRVYDMAENKNENGETAVRDYVEKKASLTPGAAGAVSRYVYHQIQLSRVTPFMRALGEFPRYIYNRVPLSPDLAPWMPEDLAAKIRKLQTAYAARKVDRPEVVLFELLDQQWGADGFRAVMGAEVKRPVWWSEARRKELSRLLAEARSIPALYSSGGTASRPSRIWLSGPKQGKTHFMRDCALTLALLHPNALVGYCMFNACQLTPQQIWQLHGPHVPQGEMAFDVFEEQLTRTKLTPFFFSDELEYLYEQRIKEPLEQLQKLGRSGYAVSVITGTVAQLPHMISSSHRLPQYVGMPDLNHHKHQPLCLPPIVSWDEAQDLAKTVGAPRWSDKYLETEEGKAELRRLCWHFAGSLGAMIAHLQGTDTSTRAPPLQGDPIHPSVIMVGLVSRVAQLGGVTLGDAFTLPSVSRDLAVEELKSFNLSQPDDVLLQLKNDCVIVEVDGRFRFRLVHPVHVEEYRTMIVASGCTIGVVQEFRRTGRRGVQAENEIIKGVAASRGLSVMQVALGDLRDALQRLRKKGKKTAEDLRFEGCHLFTFAAEEGTDGLEMSIAGGCVGPKIEQNQVKVYPGTKLIPARQMTIASSAGSGLAKVLYALGAQVTDVTLHIWYYGEPVGVVAPDLARVYRTAFDQRRLALGEQLVPRCPHPRVTVELHEHQEVLDVLPPTLRGEIEQLPAPWSLP